MKWTSGRQSDNVEDQRGGMGRALPVGGGVGALILGLAYYLFTGDPSALVNPPVNGPNGPTTSINRGANPQQQPQQQPQQDAETKFVSVVLADTEDVWGELFRRNGRQYRNPKLVLFSGQTQSACGVAGSSTGPFYCPEDQKLYLDTSFFREMSQNLNAPGDFAQAYVIAHEIGHHVQNQLGTLGKAQALENRSSKAEANAISVRTELQADFYAGVWAHYAAQRRILDPGDIEEALGAASAVGDDRLQQAARGYVVPDSFTHGTSAQRAAWFKRGLDSGDIRQGNTFQ